MVSEGRKSLHSISGLRHSVRRPLLALLLLLSFHAAAQDDLDKRDKVESSGIFNVTWIDNQLSSSGQIHAEHAPLLQSLGVKTVVNLAVYNEEYNGSENQWVVEHGMTYIHLPVDFDRPTSSDLERFYQLMDAIADETVWVHCIANYRASAFTYLYRINERGDSRKDAKALLDQIWTDELLDEYPQWAELMTRHESE
jgi:uncharacterized protein (TIGR01244 family)